MNLKKKMQTDRENHISTEASPLEIMLKVGRAITNITQVVNKIQVSRLNGGRSPAQPL